MGLADEPGITLDEAFSDFDEKIRAEDLAKKSENQRRKWKELKLAGIRNFKEVVGDIPIESITREHAVKFYEHCLDRVVAKDKKVKPISGSRGNKDLGTMRALYGEYMIHVGWRDLALKNPFSGLNFDQESKTPRPSFTETWIRGKILAPGALDERNDPARYAVLSMINTGARPSEIVNLLPEHIVLGAEIPHIVIMETIDRQLIARSLRRRIPLLGVSLDAMKEAKDGFPRYRDKDTLSANKYLRSKGLLESSRHTLYGFRHGFEERMKLAGVDEELRVI